MTTMLTGAHRRYALSVPVELQHQGCRDAAGLLIELTQETARISQLDAAPYAPGDAVTLTTPCGKVLDAQIRWAHAGRAGVRFRTALHLPELSELVTTHRRTAVA